MKKIILTCVCVSALLMGGSFSGAYAAETSRPTTRIELLTKDSIKKLAKIDEEHSILPALSGNWDFDLKYWSNKDSEPQLSTGTATNEMILGGRYLSSKANVVLNIGGQNIPYEGHYILGYDSVKKSYSSALVDTMHTGVTTGVGHYNEKSKTLEAKGSFSHPVIGKERVYRFELQMTNDDGYRQTVFMDDDSGKEFKVLEMDFRKKM